MQLEADIAGVRVALSGLDAPLFQSWSRFPVFSGSGSSLAIDLSVRPRDVRIPSRTAAGEAPEYPLEIHRDGDRLDLRSWFFEGWVDLRARRGSATLDPRDATSSVENFLRVAIAHLLLPEGGFLLHAAAVMTARGAVICFGPSDAGKTTISTLAGTRPVISDDLIACRRNARGRLVVVPTPFRAGGADARPEGHEVEALFRLQKGSHHSIERLGAIRGALEIVGAMPFVHDERLASECALRLACDAAAAPGVQRLTFVPEASVWNFIEASLDSVAEGGDRVVE